MKCYKQLQRWGLVLAFSLLTGCVTGPKLVSHSFSCNQWNDGWAKQADLLEYRYGDQEKMLSEKVSPEYQSLGCGNSTIAMPVAEFLYVKWRLKATGEIIEDRVDLRGRLPADMYMQTVTFVIDGKQLYVYLVTREEVKRRIADADRPQRTWLSMFRVAYEIYPTRTLRREEPRGTNT